MALPAVDDSVAAKKAGSESPAVREVQLGQPQPKQPSALCADHEAPAPPEPEARATVPARRPSPAHPASALHAAPRTAPRPLSTTAINTRAAPLHTRDRFPLGSSSRLQ